VFLYQEDTAEFLEDVLSKLGLNFKERNDFIVFWLPAMQKNKYNLVRFLGEEFSQEVDLKITPKPDTFIRVFMIFKAVDEKINTKPEPLRTPQRKGFVAVEWGGMNLDEKV